MADNEFLERMLSMLPEEYLGDAVNDMELLFF